MYVCRTVTISVVITAGTVRIGLDIDGGSATFAVRMMERSIKIVKTSMNLNGPFSNFIALRGVVHKHFAEASFLRQNV